MLNKLYSKLFKIVSLHSIYIAYEDDKGFSEWDSAGHTVAGGLTGPLLSITL